MTSDDTPSHMANFCVFFNYGFRTVLSLTYVVSIIFFFGKELTFFKFLLVCSTEKVAAYWFGMAWRWLYNYWMFNCVRVFDLTMKEYYVLCSLTPNSLKHHHLNDVSTNIHHRWLARTHSLWRTLVKQCYLFCLFILALRRSWVRPNIITTWIIAGLGRMLKVLSENRIS